LALKRNDNFQLLPILFIPNIITAFSSRNFMT